MLYRLLYLSAMWNTNNLIMKFNSLLFILWKILLNMALHKVFQAIETLIVLKGLLIR